MTTSSPPAPPPDRHQVTAVLVAHDGERLLPRVLESIDRMSRPPDRLVAVDTGSVDRSPRLLAEHLGEDAVLSADRGTGFGAAVALGLRAADRTGPPSVAEWDWVWVLHDDVAPEPDVLVHLLRHVDRHPDVAVAGPKVLGWSDPTLLRELGVTTTAGGRRETGLERRERDQGQHDGVHRVLAVGSAGMLVRRDVWDVLGGFDRCLPMFRDDLDLGWRATLAGHRVHCVTDAVVHHAESAGQGRRAPDAAPGRRHRADRQSALYVLLANLPAWRLPWTVPRLVLGSLGRALGLLVGKAPRDALDELAALVCVLARADRLLLARRSRARTRVRPSGTALPLLAGPLTGVRHAVDAVGGLVTGASGGSDVPAGRHRVAETGPVADEAEDLPSWRGDLLRRTLRRRSVPLLLVLVALAAVAARELVGGGRLSGGALLPAPDSAADLWRAYTADWHPVGLGSDAAAPPHLAVVAALGTLLLGSAAAAVDLVLLGAVPLAGMSAYLSARRLVRSGALRAWAAVSYGLLPPVLAGTATGRLGTAAAAVLLPLLGLAVARVLHPAGGVRAVCGAGMLLAAVAAFTPVLYLVALVLALCAAIAWPGAGRLARSGRLAAVLAVPPVLLAPWLPALVTDPGLLLVEAGLRAPVRGTEAARPWELLLLDPGGPGAPPTLLLAGLLLAALAALLRAERRSVVAAGWATAGTALVAALLLPLVAVTDPGTGTAEPVWPGPAVLAAGTGLLLAAVVGADGARLRVARASFGWRQPAAAVLAAVVAAGPVLVGGWWLARGADGPLQRVEAEVLPAFVLAEAARPGRPNTLVLRPGADEPLTYALLRTRGPRLGDAETAAPPGGTAGRARLGRVVQDLASGRGADVAPGLVPFGVRFVLLRTGGAGGGPDAALARALDSAPGLVRVAGTGTSRVWRLGLPSGRARLVPATTDPPASGRVLPSSTVGLRTDVPSGPAGRVVALADRRDPGWRATLDGQALPARTVGGWAQGFALSAAGGRLVVEHRDDLRSLLLWGQVGALLLLVVLALPGLRTRGRDSSGVADIGDAGARS